MSNAHLPGIGFEILRGSGAGWRAGAVYYTDLLHAVRVAAPRMRLLLVRGHADTGIPDELLPLTDGIATYAPLKRGSPTWALSHARRNAFRGELEPDRALRQQGIEVLVTGVLERRTDLPVLALLPDFQHKHLPELFSPEEIHWRDGEFAKTAERAARILVFGESVRADVQEFIPQYAAKVRILPPVTFVPDGTYEQEPNEILKKYGLPEKFVYLPNQFWQHKNHKLAFEAVRILCERGTAITLVCTGTPMDWRTPAYFSDLLQFIARGHIRAQIIILGTVPRADVFALIRQSAFVLNPSRFEGYGLALAEARAVGKRVLASDLPAHREQQLEHITYFDPASLQDFADKLRDVWNDSKPGPDPVLEAQARAVQPARLRAYGDRFIQIVREVYP